MGLMSGLAVDLIIEVLGRVQEDLDQGDPQRATNAIVSLRTVLRRSIRRQEALLGLERECDCKENKLGEEYD